MKAKQPKAGPEAAAGTNEAAGVNEVAAATGAAGVNEVAGATGAAGGEPVKPAAKPVRRWLPFLFLHVIFLIYSMSAILSKLAAGSAFFSPRFLLCYGGALALLVVYALVWQWILKFLPLTVAYLNKGVTIIWGMVWGFLIFHESISIAMVVGAVIVFVGIILVVTDRG